jgi:hypothetical protein
MIFEIFLHTDVTICNALESNIYLGKLIDSLCTNVIDVPNRYNSKEDVLRKFEAFFEVLRKELDEWGIEEVVIGMALDVTGCEISRTIEMTPHGIFTCKDGKREVGQLQDILRDIYPPQHIIGNVIHDITTQQNKKLIDRLDSDIKYVRDLVTTKCRLPEVATDNNLCERVSEEDEQ